MEGVDDGSPRARPGLRDGWVELFPFVLFAVTGIATIVAIVVT